MLLMVSGDDGLKSSEGTGVADIKTKRLFVTGEAQHILFLCILPNLFVHVSLAFLHSDLFLSFVCP